MSRSIIIHVIIWKKVLVKVLKILATILIIEYYKSALHIYFKYL
jgi:hypothetical protein